MGSTKRLCRECNERKEGIPFLIDQKKETHYICFDCFVEKNYEDYLPALADAFRSRLPVPVGLDGSEQE